jgi:hypothetical protein
MRPRTLPLRVVTGGVVAAPLLAALLRWIAAGMIRPAAKPAERCRKDRRFMPPEYITNRAAIQTDRPVDYVA